MPRLLLVEDDEALAEAFFLALKGLGHQVVLAGTGEAALDVVETAMRVCGGAAFRKDLAVERCFRDAHAAGVMGPTTDVLYDFIGKAVCGQPLF